MLESLFGWGKASKCKALVKIVISRVKLLRNKREILIKQLRHDVAQLFIKGQLQSSFSRTDLVFKEQNLLHGYDMVEQFCECILKQLSYIRRHKDRPQDINEALSSLIFAAARCADLPELQRLRSFFVKRYGLEFASASVELLPGSGVNKQIIEKLSVGPPTYISKLNLMKEIAGEFNLQWDSSIEAEICKPTEDSLTKSRGPKNFKSCQEAVDSVRQPSLHALTENVGPEEKTFDRDIPVISSSIKEVCIVPAQNGGTLGLEKQESLPCAIALQSRDNTFSQRSNRDKFMKDTSFESCDVAGVDDVRHYVSNNNPSASATGSTELAAGVTLLTANLAKSSKLSTEGNMFDVYNVEEEENISDLEYFHRSGTKPFECKLSRRTPNVEDLYSKEDTRFPEWSKEIVDSDSELRSAMYFEQSNSQREFDLNPQMQDLQDFSKAEVNCSYTGRRDVSSGKEHRSEHQYSSRTGKKVRSKSRRRRSVSSHYPIDMNSSYDVNHNDGADGIFRMAKWADPLATVSSRKNNTARDRYNEQFAKVQDGVNLRMRSIHSTLNQVTPQLSADRDRPLSQNGRRMSCDMLDCYIDSDTGDESSIVSECINPEKVSPSPIHVKLNSRKTLKRRNNGQEQDSFEATRQDTSKVYNDGNGNSGKLRSKEETNDFHLKDEEKLHETYNYSEQGFFPNEKAYIISSIDGASSKLPQLIEEATKSSPQVFKHSRSSFSGTLHCRDRFSSKKSPCHLDNNGLRMEQQFQQYNIKRESHKPALIRSYVSDQMRYKDGHVFGSNPQRERNRSLDLAHKHLHDIDIDSSDLEDQYSRLSDSTVNYIKEKQVRNFESVRRDFDGSSYEYRQHRGSNKLLEKTCEGLESEGDSFERLPAEKIHTPRVSVLDTDRAEKVQWQRSMRYYMEDNEDDQLLSGRQGIPKADFSHIQTKQHAYARKLRERDAVSNLARDEEMQNSLDVACHIRDAKQSMSRHPPVAPTLCTKSVSMNKIPDSVMPQKMQFIKKNSDLASNTDTSTASYIAAAAPRTSSRPPLSPSTTQSASSSKLLSHAKPSSPASPSMAASPSMGPPQRTPPKPPCTWERAMSLPPERSRASPVRLAVRSNSLQSNASTECPSYGHSPRTPHVHPKLPDYDDLAAKFTQLKQQYRMGTSSK